MDLSASISERLGLQCKGGFVQSVRVVRKEEKKTPKHIRRCLPPAASEKESSVGSSSVSGNFTVGPSFSAVRFEETLPGSVALEPVRSKGLLPPLPGRASEHGAQRTVLLKAVDSEGFPRWVPHRLVELSTERHIKFDVKCTFGARLGPSFLSSGAPSPSPPLTNESEGGSEKREKRHGIVEPFGQQAGGRSQHVSHHACTGHLCKQCATVTDQLEQFERRLQRIEEERQASAAKLGDC